MIIVLLGNARSRLRLGASEPAAVGHMIIDVVPSETCPPVATDATRSALQFASLAALAIRPHYDLREKGSDRVRQNSQDSFFALSSPTPLV